MAARITVVLFSGRRTEIRGKNNWAQNSCLLVTVHSVHGGVREDVKLVGSRELDAAAQKRGMSNTADERGSEGGWR